MQFDGGSDQRGKTLGRRRAGAGVFGGHVIRRAEAAQAVEGLLPQLALGAEMVEQPGEGGFRFLAILRIEAPS